LAVASGLILGPTGLFPHYLEHTTGMPATEPHHLDWTIMAGGTIAALAGIFVSWLMYAGTRSVPAQLARLSGPLYGFSQNRFYVDELLSWLIVKPLKAVGQIGVLVDRYVIDGLLDLIAGIPRSVGFVLRPLQNGRVPSYAILMLTGLTACLIVLIVLDSL